MNFSLKALQSALAFAAVTLLMSVPAVAQTRFCIGGDLEGLSAGERASCNAAKDTAKLTAARLQAPEDWHFVIVCGEQGWKDYTAVAQQGEVALNDSAADTDLDQHVTYLRESRLRESQNHPLQPVVAHEVASIKLGTHDERMIEAQVSAWTATVNAQIDNGTAAGHRGAKPVASGVGI